MWTCPDCSYVIKSAVRYPIKCKCGETDYGRPNDATIEWCDEPAHSCPRETNEPKKRRGGAGTILKRKLWWFNKVVWKKCRCNKYARRMDREGPDWCVANIDTIVNWLRGSHAKLPDIVRTFVPFVESLVRSTILAAVTEAREAGYR